MQTTIKWLTSGFVLFCAFAANAQTKFRNPIITGMNPDPSVCRANDDYYLVTSTFEYFPGLPIYQSKDLVNWKRIGYALSRESNNPLMGCESSYGGQYAATIRYHDGLFVIVGTNYGGQGSRGDFYVTAKDPAGPWSDPVWLDKWYVDPSLLFADGKTYFLSPDNKGSFLLGEIDLATGNFLKEPVKIAEGLGGSSPEGPHLYKINGYYYLMSAEGGTGYEHREVVQRSESAYGPYEPSPRNPVVSNMSDPHNPFQAIGHADIVETPDGWWLVCLGIRPKEGRYHHLGRETFLAPVSWDADGWPRVGESGVVYSDYVAPNLPRHVWENEPARDDFDGQKLGLAWNFVRNPHDADWSLSQRPGYIRLHGSSVSFEQKDSPVFVCRRQTAFNMDLSTKVEFSPTAENEEAGLVVRGNDSNHYDLVITLADGRRLVKFRRTIKGIDAECLVEEIPEGPVTLRIRATDSEYTFWAQADGGVPQLVASAATKDLSTEAINGFTGVFIGMYASGNGSSNTNPADFDWFDVEENVCSDFGWMNERANQK